MVMKKFLTFTTIIALSLYAVPAQASTLLAYWNMDDTSVNGKLAVNDGVQSSIVSAGFVDISTGFFSEIGNADGTTDNIVGSAPLDNNSVGFYRAFTVYNEGAFEMYGLDFTNFTDGQLSFAVRSQNNFTWDTNLHVDYRFNNAPIWSQITETITYNNAPNWNVSVIDFGSLLDGQSDVDLRIRMVSWASVTGWIDIDNVQVTSIPEPASVLLLAAGGTLLIVRRRR